MLPLSLYLGLLGAAYEKGARGPFAFDCLGLAMEVARRLGKKVPNYVSDEAELHRQLGEGAATLADMPQIPLPVPGCIALFRVTPTQHHLGVMIDPYRMLHAFERTGVVIERVHSPQWKRKLIGYYSLDEGAK